MIKHRQKKLKIIYICDDNNMLRSGPGITPGPLHNMYMNMITYYHIYGNMSKSLINICNNIIEYNDTLSRLS